MIYKKKTYALIFPGKTRFGTHSALISQEKLGFWSYIALISQEKLGLGTHNALISKEMSKYDAEMAEAGAQETKMTRAKI